MWYDSGDSESSAPTQDDSGHGRYPPHPGRVSMYKATLAHGIGQENKPGAAHDGKDPTQRGSDGSDPMPCFPSVSNPYITTARTCRRRSTPVKESVCPSRPDKYPVPNLDVERRFSSHLRAHLALFSTRSKSTGFALKKHPPESPYIAASLSVLSSGTGPDCMSSGRQT